MADKKLNLNSLLSKENSEKVDKTEEKETNINPETSVENPTINDYPDSDNFVIWKSKGEWLPNDNEQTTSNDSESSDENIEYNSSLSDSESREDEKEKTDKEKKEDIAKEVIGELKDEIGLTRSDEEITSKVSIDDVIDESSAKNSDSELFENYKSDFEEIKEEITEKWKDSLPEDDKKNTLDDTKKSLEEVVGVENNEPKEKKSNKIFPIILVIILLVALFSAFYFRNELKDLINKDDKTETNTEIDIPTDIETNTGSFETDTEIGTDTEIDTNNNDNPVIIPDDEGNNNDENPIIDDFIDETKGNTPLTIEERNKLIKNKIIEIYSNRGTH